MEDGTRSAEPSEHRSDDGLIPLGAGEPGNERLDHYLARTQTPLDLLALCTLWIVIVPPRLFSSNDDVATVGLTVRIGLSVIYGIDMLARTRLAHRRVRYLRQHVVGLVAVVFPPVRVLFSLRLIRMLFRRGNLDRLLLAATVLMLNCAIVVFFYERDAPGGNIKTFGESIWWAIVTVTTVGYGDYYPVTVVGKIMASFIMAIGITTVAIITAQVASAFVDQAARRQSAASTPTDAADAVDDSGGADVPEVTLAEIDQRLARIEALVASISPSPGTDAE
jgi:voltage-gated potassium channel